MILHSSTNYWSTGITVRQVGEAWSGSLDYLDDGFCDDAPDTGSISTEGTLRTRYLVKDGASRSALSAVVDALLADAERLGVTFREPSLYYAGDDEGRDWPPPHGWRELLYVEERRIGWAR